ncbi:MAG: hypothetical protein K2N16_06615, partial [Muribaculaceae bacterium]|nr:hypothetical protein [Muribaculaceae bacterium]
FALYIQTTAREPQKFLKDLIYQAKDIATSKRIGKLFNYYIHSETNRSPNGGPQPQPRAAEPIIGQADYKGWLALKSCLFGVSSHPLVWYLQSGGAIAASAFLL